MGRLRAKPRPEKALPPRASIRRLVRLAKPSPLRADAARNRERLIAEARRFFSAGGATVSLDGIAQAAGVGVATLYRNFATREALVEAVYRSELDALAADADALLAAHGALDALRLWMDGYARFVATKHAMRDVLGIDTGDARPHRGHRGPVHGRGCRRRHHSRGHRARRRHLVPCRCRADDDCLDRRAPTAPDARPAHRRTASPSLKPVLPCRC